jgi:hypothetical protein
MVLYSRRRLLVLKSDRGRMRVETCLLCLRHDCAVRFRCPRACTIAGRGVNPDLKSVEAPMQAGVVHVEIPALVCF